MNNELYNELLAYAQFNEDGIGKLSDFLEENGEREAAVLVRFGKIRWLKLLERKEELKDLVNYILKHNIDPEKYELQLRYKDKDYDYSFMPIPFNYYTFVFERKP